MAKVTQISSQTVNTAYAWEATAGVTPSNPLFRLLDLTSYSDGGASYEATPRSVMAGNRRLQKGSQTSASSKFGYAIDNTIDNTTAQVCTFLCNTPVEQPTTCGALDGHPSAPARIAVTLTASDTITLASGEGMFAVNDIIQLVDGTNDRRAQVVTATDTTKHTLTVTPVKNGTALSTGIPVDPKRVVSVRRVGVVLAGTSTIYMTDDAKRVTIEAPAAVWANKSVKVGQWLFIGNDATSLTGNNQPFFGRVVGISGNVLTFDTTTIAISTSKDQLTDREVYIPTMITDSDKLISSTHTRYLGVNSDGKHMRENIKGCYANEMTINCKERSLSTMDLSYIAMSTEYANLTDADNATYTANTLSPPKTDPINMSTDVVRQRLTVVDASKTNTASIHSFIKESTIQVQNNLQELTANGLLGSIGVSAGDFSATGTLNTYFTDTQALNAVKCNCTVALDWTFARKNQGLVIDIPALTLSADAISVEKGNSLMLNLNQSAFESSQFGYTLSYNVFHYLPTVASPSLACNC